VHSGGPAEASRPQNEASLLPCGAFSVQFPRTSSFVLAVQEKFRLTVKTKRILWRPLRPAPVPNPRQVDPEYEVIREQRIVAFQGGLHNFTWVGSSIAEAVLRERHFPSVSL
jgi:hypothetical protein